jgi:hypothetical protein
MNSENKKKISFQVDCDDSIDRIKARANILAHLISMPIQLKDLRISQFEWLLDIVQYVSISIQ